LKGCDSQIAVAGAGSCNTNLYLSVFIIHPIPSVGAGCDSFRYRRGRAAFYNGLKSKVGLAVAKAAALRVNLNINRDGCSIVAPPPPPPPQISNLHNGKH